MNAKYYKPSGKFTPIGLLTATAIGVLGVIIASWLYGYLMAWIPIVYLMFLGVFGFGLAAGGLTCLGVTIGKIRNSGVALVLGLLVGLVGLYSGWVAWIYAMSSQEVFVWRPVELWNVIKTLSETGVWNIRDMTPKGMVLGAFWLVEALVVLGTCLYMAKDAATNSAFCEDCGSWMEDPVTLGLHKTESNVEAFRRGFELGKLEVISELKHDFEAQESFLVSSSESCDSCKKTHLFSLAERSLTTDKDGNIETKDKKLMDRLFVKREAIDELRKQFEAAEDAAALAAGESPQTPPEPDSNPEEFG